jgi:hypothetical protein
VAGVETTNLLDTAAPLTMILAEMTGSGTTHYLHGLDLAAESDGAASGYFLYDGLGSARQLFAPYSQIAPLRAPAPAIGDKTEIRSVTSFPDFFVQCASRTLSWRWMCFWDGTNSRCATSNTIAKGSARSSRLAKGLHKQ